MSYSWLDMEEDLLLLGMFSQELIVMLAAYALVDFTFFLSIEEIRRRKRPIPRCALTSPYFSSFQMLLASRNDQAYITVTGLDVATFHELLVRFEPLYKRYSPYTTNGKIVPLRHEQGTRGGRPRSLDGACCLGLVLCYTRTHGSLFALQLMYGVTHSVLIVFLKFGMRLLYKVLKEDETAQVHIPSPEKISEFQDVIRVNFPALDGAWSVMDGLKLLIQKPGEEAIQNGYYNGWLHDHFVSCVYVFVPSGHIVAETLNNPGSRHDSICALNGNLYNTLADVYDRDGGKCVVDSAFSQKRCRFLIKSGKEKLGESADRRRVRQQATAVRQSVEWGMRAVQGSFPRLKDRFLFLEGSDDRRIFLHLISMLLNYRTSSIGLNQLQSTFYPIFHNVGDNALDLFNRN
jgi:hypothetical protein